MRKAHIDYKLLESFDMAQACYCWGILFRRSFETSASIVELRFRDRPKAAALGKIPDANFVALPRITMVQIKQAIALGEA